MTSPSMTATSRPMMTSTMMSQIKVIHTTMGRIIATLTMKGHIPMTSTTMSQTVKTHTMKNQLMIHPTTTHLMEKSTMIDRLLEISTVMSRILMTDTSMSHLSSISTRKSHPSMIGPSMSHPLMINTQINLPSMTTSLMAKTSTAPLTIISGSKNLRSMGLAQLGHRPTAKATLHLLKESRAACECHMCESGDCQHSAFPQPVCSRTPRRKHDLLCQNTRL
ncbi:uncharacterized protein BO95DRAFT_88623 [Aspergillus brunneoviolaceus CBS 621.78]|uniref:Uncharacterized protein n=1 Tax=Aspergillus brunneoviolaceus CBS 621.78 TaxID=1450534 RepID=A0ACD1GDC4_9EURO|nr:hypothetical protein BO95DRAFT_88623 [Aspergillus brunneoviolaceus CBS 621.78]RAH47310.1 hypothetical protein BO95DRAFT_88623 [Aspergillus brunneoviolaceus CBS 621.78]